VGGVGFHEGTVTVLSPRGTARERFEARAAAADAPAPQSDDDIVPTHLGWEIARSAPGTPPEDRRAIEALAGACIAALRAGSTRMPVDRDRLATALAGVGAADALDATLALLARARAGDAGPASAVLGAPGERKPLVLEGDFLSTEKMRDVEQRFCARVVTRLARPAVADERTVRKCVQAVAGGPPPLSDEQRGAVRAALSAGMALVTGGPGTGKTTIVVALLRALHWVGVPAASIAVAAPTGKAAHRLEQAIAAGLAAGPRDLAQVGLAEAIPSPQTLHRLLGWSPEKGRFARHENDPLQHAVVVVDEASMIDLLMMDRLLGALKDDARLVLLGDADQLPSVEAGAVFRDLCAGLGAVRLTRNLRVASDPAARRIVDAALAVNAGTTDGPFKSAVRPVPASALTFQGVEHVQAPFASVADAFLERWWSHRMAATPDFARLAARTYRVHDGALRDDDREDLGALLDHHSSARILCATRLQGHPASAEGVNERLLARLAQDRLAQDGGSRARRGPRRGGRLLHGAPVLVQRNDYERRLYNGDQGVVVRVDRGRGAEPELMAAFARTSGFELWPLDELPDLAAAFAMTVHKAQGSEFDHVALVLPDADLPLLTRELVYTAITRARRSVTIVGPADLLARAVSRVTERHSGIAHRLLSR
jgi:exodeoxyribonuclease V alpha subunit